MDVSSSGTRLNGAGGDRYPHICGFFDSRDDEYRVLGGFVKEGLERGEKALHVVDPALRDDHLGRLAAIGIPVGAAQASGQLDVRGWDEIYMRAGHFDADATLAQFEDTLQRVKKEGFPGIRVIGHAEWAAEDRVALDELAQYEARADAVLSHYGAPLVCVYSRGRFPSDVAHDVLRAHPMAITGGAVRENPSYLPPEELLAELRSPGRAVALLRHRYLAALLAGDRREALDVLVEEGLWCAVPVPQLYLEVVQPALSEIGRLCEARKIGPAHVHLAAGISRLALAHLSPHLPSAPQNGKLVVVASVAGEGHDLAAHMIADLFEAAGFSVRFLGASLPIETLVAFVEESRPNLLALSAPTAANLIAVRETVAAVRHAMGDQVLLAAGGQAFSSHGGLAEELGLDLQSDDPTRIVAGARRLLDV